MPIVLIALLTLNLAVLSWLLWRQLRSQRLLRELASTATALQPLHAALDSELTRHLRSSGDTVIGIEILNPLEVAAKANWIAGPVGGLAPSLIRREVYRQARSMMEAQLRERGIEPRVQIYQRR